MATTAELIQRQIDAIPTLRTLASSEHSDFKRWKQVTDAILERRLGETKAHQFDIRCDYWPNFIGPWEPEELKEALNNGLDSAEAFLKALLEEIEMFGDGSTEERSSSNTFGKVKMGEAGNAGQPGSGGSVYIQAENFHMTGSGKISADGGDLINTTHGDGSPISVNMGQVTNIIEQLNKEFEQNYSGQDKEDVLALVKQLKTQSTNPDKRKFRQIAGMLLTRGAEIAQIASLIAQLLSMMHK